MLNLDAVRKHQAALETHPLLTTDVLRSKQQLATFMEHHVYCVWDFMSLVKCLQSHIAPSTVPWLPGPHTRNGAARLINSIIVAEESDCFDGRYVSHFDLYLEAMEEIGADTSQVINFVDKVSNGVNTSTAHAGKLELAMSTVPAASREFMKSTFGFIETKKPHIAAAAFAFGRETVIPGMYMNMVQQLGISEMQAPKFYAWLRRHIEVDTDDHGPAALELVEIFCDNDAIKYREAQDAAHKSIDDKIVFWDTVRHVIHGR